MTTEVAFWTPTAETVRVLSRSDVWGTTSALIHRPSTNETTQVPASELSPAHLRPWVAEELAWRACVGRALALMASGHLTGAEDDLIPLPHQIAVVEYALSHDPVRLLLADEVGLGKTIEAGLIMRELLRRDRIRRIAVVAPKGVQLQWIAEMKRLLGDTFVLVGPAGVPTDLEFDPWRAFDRAVCSIDAVKPLRIRAGWDEERVARYNRGRFDAFVGAGWDLVVIDEAHHVAGATEDVARHQLAVALAARSPHLLLLSATPHSGKSEAFGRLLGLLDTRFAGGAPLNRESVAPLVVRNAKRTVVDEEGRPVFQPRTTALIPVPYGDRRVQRALYEAVTDYVRDGYNRAKLEGRRGYGFLVLLMQRLVSSSTAAIAAALERRAVALADEHAQLRMFSVGAEEWADLSGEEQFAAFAEARAAAFGDELAEVEILRDIARRALSEGVDAKARHLLELLAELSREERNPSLKAVIFTEFVPTQRMLVEFLEGAGIATATINGSMSLSERESAQQEFRTAARVLISTDAGGEGINLQFAHIVINYDLPWNPMRIEQRIGRVDRIGQAHAVKAFNLAMESSVDERVLTVLQDKLATIRSELGVDKTNDVLESAGRHLDDAFTAAILEPDGIEARVDVLLEQARHEAAEAVDLDSLVDAPPRRSTRSTASVQELLRRAADAYQSWAPSRVLTETAALLELLPEVFAEEAVPVIPGETHGWWALWEVRPLPPATERDCVAVFVTDAGEVRPDVASATWTRLTSGVEPVAALTLETQHFEALLTRAKEYAYNPNRAPKAGAVLVPRLIVRTEP